MRNFLEQSVLPLVTKPARYLGTEWNSVHKSWDEVEVHMAFAFPDVYEVGMSHLGLRILYHLINDRQDTVLERVFAPWVDMEEKLRQHQLPLFTLESTRPVRDFDIVGFTLQYEMSFTNILNMLDLAGIPLLSSQRETEQPLIIAGGPCAFNPEPLADFIDAFVIGEGEEVMHELLDAYKSWKGQNLTKQELLLQLAQIPGVYVPTLYEVTYDDAGTFVSIHPTHAEAPAQVVRRVVKDFDQAPFPTQPIVPFMEIVHDRIMLEVLRGCTRGCRFCQAGVLYRPVREKSPETLLNQAKELVQSTGYNEISLTSLSTSDYTCIGPVVEGLLDAHAEEGIGISLPSLRIDSFSVDIAQQVQRVRKTGLTFAPEAGTQRMRDVINKGVTEQNLIDAVTAAFRHGWTTIKLYFMIGLPTETFEDLAGIAQLANKVVYAAKQEGVGAKGKGLKVTVSASSFVPKPHTPFQFEPQDTLEALREKQTYLKSLITNKKITFNWHDAKLSSIEGVFARGDRKLSKVLLKAWELGCKFDGWTEHFKYENWLQAFAEVGMDQSRYAQAQYPYAQTLPWDHIQSGVSKDYLVQEHQRAMEAAVTPDCRFTNCQGCSLCPDLNVDICLHGGGNHE